MSPSSSSSSSSSSSNRHRMRELPAFIPPMLAKAGEPFDSDRHLFEIKWDGTRALAFIDRRGHQLLNRRRVDMTDRYPEMEFLSKNLPKGTILDGEIVVLRNGKPDFNALQKREHARSARKITMVSRSTPATFIAFDLLFDSYEVLIERPLSERRERLRELVDECDHPRLIMSEGVVGSGTQYFAEACKLGLEGVVAKRLDSPYLPGQRTDCWIKIKRQETYACAVIGFTRAETVRPDFSALVIASEIDGKFQCVGRVGSGFDGKLRDRINGFLWSHLREQPVIPCREKALWVEPGLYCEVRCMERTKGGMLRAPVFVGEL
jgi:DNA ligase D-like protein (predicted ligase)